jgi:hypothetical protein
MGDVDGTDADVAIVGEPPARMLSGDVRALMSGDNGGEASGDASGELPGVLVGVVVGDDATASDIDDDDDDDGGG